MTQRRIRPGSILLVLLLVMLIMTVVRNMSAGGGAVAYSDMCRYFREEKVQSFTITGDKLTAKLQDNSAVSCTICSVETIYTDMAGLVQSTPDRKTLYAVQTPQVFQANILKAALQSAIQAGADITDDCSAVERLGKEVWLAPGWRENIKITTREDLTMAEAFLRERENRA